MGLNYLNHIRMTSLKEYLSEHGYFQFEGNSGELPDQTVDLKRFATLPHVKHIMEIGFNAGHSANTFLNANPFADVVSFDLGCHPYVNFAKQYIDMTYEGRHQLILGDSQKTLVEYGNTNPNKTFDLIFIDGGHEYDIALNDMMNCMKFAHENTIVILDDVVRDSRYVQDYTVGPSRVWNECKAQGLLREIEYRYYGFCRGQVVGQYIISPKNE